MSPTISKSTSNDELLDQATRISSDRIVHLIFFVIAIVIFQVVIAQQQSFAVSKEAKRRWQHAITGHALVQVSYFLSVELCITGLALGCAGIYYIRYHQEELYLQLFGALLRADEMHQQRQEKRDSSTTTTTTTTTRIILPGAFYFLLGTALTTALFPMNIARYAVECLALADPMAAWVGQANILPQSNPRIHAKASVAGCIACFVTATFIGVVMLMDINNNEGGNNDDNSSIRLWQVIVGGLACCVAESSPYGNDNLLIPLITAAAFHMTI